MCFTTIALVTDHDAGVEGGEAVTHAEVLRVFADNVSGLKQTLRAAHRRAARGRGRRQRDLRLPARPRRAAAPGGAADVSPSAGRRPAPTTGAGHAGVGPAAAAPGLARLRAARGVAPGPAPPGRSPPRWPALAGLAGRRRLPARPRARWACRCWSRCATCRPVTALGASDLRVDRWPEQIRPASALQEPCRGRRRDAGVGPRRRRGGDRVTAAWHRAAVRPAGGHGRRARAADRPRRGGAGARR